MIDRTRIPNMALKIVPCERSLEPLLKRLDGSVITVAKVYAAPEHGLGEAQAYAHVLFAAFLLARVISAMKDATG